MILLLIGLLTNGCVDDNKTNQTDVNTSINIETKPNISKYQVSAQPLNYRDTMFEKTNNGELIIFVGKIMQASNDFANISTEFHEDLGDYLGNDVYLEFKNRPQVLEDDVVRIYGRYNGIKTYTSVVGQEVTVPNIIVDYYTANRQTYDASNNQLVNPKADFSLYKSSAQISDLIFSRATCNGKLLLIKGQISNLFHYTIETSNSRSATLSFPTTQPKIKDDNIAEIYGRCIGISTGENIFNMKISSPVITVDYYTVNGQTYDAGNNQLIQTSSDTMSSTPKIQASQKEEIEPNKNNQNNDSDDDHLKNYAYKLMADMDMSSPNDIKVNKNSKGVKIYCLSDMSMCKTEEEVRDYYKATASSSN